MAQRDSNRPGAFPGPPAFFWHGLLILLPVALLAAVGFFSLRQDRRLAQREAAERAQALADQVANEIWAELTGHKDPGSPAFQVDRDGQLLFPPPFAPAPTPRPLNTAALNPEQARLWHSFLMSQVVLMLGAGLIHGDLSEFNVLVDAVGPVIIDLPQAVNAASNNNAFRMLERDVNNMREIFGRSAPELLQTHYAHEIWTLYSAGELTPDSVLTGTFVFDESAADVAGVLAHIEDERREAEERQRRLMEVMA
jgi:hypothetical protein